MTLSSFYVVDDVYLNAHDTSLSITQNEFPKLKFQAKTVEDGIELQQLSYELKTLSKQEKKMTVNVKSLRTGGVRPYEYSYSVQELDGETLIDAQSLIDPINYSFAPQTTINGQAWLKYPNKMEIGDELSPVKFEYQILTNNIPFSWQGDVVSRKVKAIENIRIDDKITSAYLIESTLHLNASCRGYAIKNTTEYLQELYLPGCGAIRVERTNETQFPSMAKEDKSSSTVKSSKAIDAKSVRKKSTSTLSNLTTNF